MNHYISFVGAGSGDKELITLKGYKRLKNADVVIYTGSLINHELLDYCKDSCIKYDSAVMNLDEIIDVIDKNVKAKKYVVRLQTGDFSIYGSIREQIEALNKLNIEYELIPGVSSFLGAASSLKVEYTVPEISQSLIITRQSGSMDTPCTVIYKATWEDEKKVIGKLSDIAEKTKQANITKTALILVGNFLGNEYNNSKLYDRGFSHEYRSSHNKPD